VLVPDSDPEASLAITAGVPSVAVKWAEEGYAVVEIKASALKPESVPSTLEAATAALSACNECEPKEKVALVGKLICPGFRHQTRAH
jgi:carboxymethylenebutenolidase